MKLYHEDKPGFWPETAGAWLGCAGIFFFGDVTPIVYLVLKVTIR